LFRENNAESETHHSRFAPARFDDFCIRDEDFGELHSDADPYPKSQ